MAGWIYGYEISIRCEVYGCKNLREQWFKGDGVIWEIPVGGSKGRNDLPRSNMEFPLMVRLQNDT